MVRIYQVIPNNALKSTSTGFVDLPYAVQQLPTNTTLPKGAKVCGYQVVEVIQMQWYTPAQLVARATADEVARRVAGAWYDMRQRKHWKA